LTSRFPAPYNRAVRLPYALVCTLLGVVLGWLPMFVHGPIPEKYNVLYIRGAVAVWGWYLARLLVGFLVGITTWPAPWWQRGPLCGLVLMLPLGFVSLATPGCGWSCMLINLGSATAIGLAVGGLARLVTGKDHA
jgi:hypothetical protein